MTEHKYQVGQEVEADTLWDGWINGTIEEVKVAYKVALKDGGISHTTVYEDSIRPRTMTPEQAWDKVAVLCGIRDSLKQDTWTSESEFDKETRHQCYQVLGKAHVKITDEVKERVRGLIQLADDTEY